MRSRVRRQTDVLPPRFCTGCAATRYRDILDRSGAFPFIKEDIVLGHEFAGTVAQCGPKANAFEVTLELGARVHAGGDLVRLVSAGRAAGGQLALGASDCLADSRSDRQEPNLPWAHRRRRIRRVLYGTAASLRAARRCPC